MPVKKASSRRRTRAESKATGGANSFSHYVRNLHGTDPLLTAFKEHSAENALPNIASWAEMRSYLVRTGAQHEAVVGARIAWREFERQ